MHELAVCQSIIEQVSRIAAEYQAQFVEKIHLQIGPLSGVEPELLESAFPIACANTAAAKAILVINKLPIRVRCDTCRSESEASASRLVCGVCGDWQTTLLSGGEMLLERVELLAEH
ncbi:MAG: hydrogenase maturation nickel metallochaperone HypA [Gammaproteobacteria bacterium]|nr:hydrogenase maturation nickel metallochaperone HypA [Gammaproteobacteria bacterium]